MPGIYKIKDLAEKYKITTRTIRFWEEKGLIDPIFRTSGKRRVYEEDVEDTVKKIIKLKNKGLSLDSIQEELSKFKHKKVTPAKSNVRIVIDSTSSINQDLAKKNDITIIPLYQHIGKNQFLDGVNINEDELYEKLSRVQKGAEISTSAATVDDFFDHYSELIKEGARTIYSIHISECYSETIYNAKKAAKQFSGVNFHIIDSKTSGQGIQLLALSLIDRLKESYTEQENVEYLNKLAENNWLIVTTTSLKTLNLMGLLNMSIETAFEPLFDQLLNFRPILVTEKGEGMFKIFSREDTVEEALEKMESTLHNKIKNSKLKLKMIGISQSKLGEKSKELKNRFEKQYKVPVIEQQGSVILCTYLGPMSLGIDVLFDV
ncbi:MAG: hypothetical protein A2Y40_03515 [Candidatus Margulisbacteria bacterium GWF2_35_9]|nr:MAG: hypothetical protein A2Y40_03515 [Candidatus Margulisbacteria bacterium GWF2_35_9]